MSMWRINNMGNKRVRKLTANSARLLSKPRLTDVPKNREERRALERWLRRNGLEEGKPK